jgi:hypothetical protein
MALASKHGKEIFRQLAQVWPTAADLRYPFLDSAILPKFYLLQITEQRSTNRRGHGQHDGSFADAVQALDFAPGRMAAARRIDLHEHER